MNRIFLWMFVIAALLGVTCHADEKLRTPYIMLDPATMPPPTAMGEAMPRELTNPATVRRRPVQLGIPKLTSKRDADGSEHIRLANLAVSLGVTIDKNGRATVDALRDEWTNADLLASPSQVFFLGGTKPASSDAYKVKRWSTEAYADYVELRVEFTADDAATAPATIVWRSRVFRNRPQIEQDFEGALGDRVLGQVLNLNDSLAPAMPANAFGRGFANGKPNIPDRHRFEVVQESDHLSYDAAHQQGAWAFVADIGGQERIARGQFALMQNPSFRTRRSNRTGIFVIQPFNGAADTGFLDLRRYISDRYSAQRDTPSLYEWNQFWLWQGGPTRVDKHVVTLDRLMDVLPRQLRMGMEEFHLDDGWQTRDQDWHLSPERFPGGWDAIKSFNRANGLAFHLWVNDGATDSADFMLDLIDLSGLSRLFMDRQVTDTTAEAVEKVRAKHPGFSTSAHGSTSRSRYWSWGNPHFLHDYNQIYFGEGEFWAWSNIKPEAKIEAVNDPLYPQRTEAERFFSRHDMYVGDLITRCAAYQAQWVWPFNATAPPHCGWAWFENRPTAELRDRIYSYLACKFNYQWGFDPTMLPREAIELHLDCTAWFKANRELLVDYRHVLDPPDGNGIDAAAHVRDGRGFVFLFNPGVQEQKVAFKSILWERSLS